MNHTALGANVANTTKRNHMVFMDEEHEQFYFEKMRQVRWDDCYHKTLIYLLGLSEDTRRNFKSIYDIETGCVLPECLHRGWVTSESAKLIRLAFHLYTDKIPTLDEYRTKDKKIKECCQYTVAELFCCSYAPYFWEAIQLRYPEYTTEREKSLVSLME